MRTRSIAFALGLLATGLAVAQPRYDDRYDDRYAPPGGGENVAFAYADVLRASPVYETFRSSEPREECYDERVERRGGDGTGGAVLGAIIGGALGNQVGKGDGRKAATMAGAVIGGTIGHDQATRGDRYAGVERRCRIIDDVRDERRLVGYDVEYRYRGEVYMSRLDFDPGDKLRVRVSVSPAD
ncbi:MAG: glycine zipper 2TM domain-containing protein [Pseudomonadota bacterium]|jgi:uncharacterized protein YcfJ